MKQKEALNLFPIYDDSPYYLNNGPFKFEAMTMACSDSTNVSIFSMS